MQDPEVQPNPGKMREIIDAESQENKHHGMTVEEEMEDLFKVHTPDEARKLREEKPRLYRIWDTSQKFFYLVDNMLVANPQNSNLPVQVMAVLPNNALDLNKHPIFMGLNDRTHTLSCVKSDGGQPQLQLVKRDILLLYEEKKEFKSFTFYTKMDGSRETCSFESAEFPGWFLSTSSEPNKPVGLSQEGYSENTLFYFCRIKNSEEEAMF